MSNQERTPTLQKDNHEIKERGSNLVEPSLNTYTHNNEPQGPRLIPNSSIHEVDEEWGNKLWDAVKFAQEETTKSNKPLLVEIDFNLKTLELELHSDYNDEKSKRSERSKANMLKTLP